MLDVLHEGDAVALFLTGGAPIPEQGKLYQTHETVRQVLAQCRVSYERADLAGKLQQARQLLAQADAANREIYVITDNQALSWEGLKDSAAVPEESAEVPVILVNVNRDPVPNVALRNLRLESAAPTAGVPTQASVEALNTSTVPQDINLELHVDGTKETVSPTLNVPPGATVKQEFHFTLRNGGVHRGEVRLAGDDGNPLDNKLYFAMAVDQEVPVAVVKPGRQEIAFVEDTFYLERALGAGGRHPRHVPHSRGAGAPRRSPTTRWCSA